MKALSIDLPGRRDFHICQACDRHMDDHPSEYSRWMEHDELDRPTTTVVMLCQPCADQIIVPHERLYSPLHVYAPMPGSMMNLCQPCHYRDGLDCTHPAQFKMGGSGLLIRYPKPSLMHINQPKRHRMEYVFHRPCSGCAGQSPVVLLEDQGSPE